MKPFLYEGTYVCFPVLTVVEDYRRIANKKLQEIVLFDRAEVNLGLGQVNFRKTSSFCEPGNFVNGVNIEINDGKWKPETRKCSAYTTPRIDILDYHQWMMKNKSIIRSNAKPGMHICCAGEWTFGYTGDIIYAGVGIGVPVDKKNAILFMECVGRTESMDIKTIDDDIIKSIEAIGKNQGIQYEKIFIDSDLMKIEKDLGCAMVAIPYFLKE